MCSKWSKSTHEDQVHRHQILSMRQCMMDTEQLSEQFNALTQ